MHTTNDTKDKTPQINTRLDIRKTPIDGTENDNDLRRHMTDKEMPYSTIDLSKACITERKKQAMYKIL